MTTAGRTTRRWRESATGIRPMLAALEPAPLRDESLVYEPKYDGIRALVEVEPGRGAAGVRIWSRRGNEKTLQFPEIVQALAQLSRKLKAAVLLDGEIVARDGSGEPAGFQHLQSRIHGTGPERERLSHSQPVAFVAFDVLRDGAEDLRPLPLTARRARLERILGSARSPVLRLSKFVAGDGTTLYREALDRRWEGLIVKELDSPYQAGRRSRHWRKLKIARRQKLVVGGVTAAALLVGVYENDALEFVGHARITAVDRARIAARLAALETPACPFRVTPPTSSTPRWLEPELVAEVAFTEWTRDGKLRHAQYLGLRDDVPPESVQREPLPQLPESPRRSRLARPTRIKPTEQAISQPVGTEAVPARRRAEVRMPPHRRAAAGERSGPREGPSLKRAEKQLLAELEALEDRGGDGVIELPGGSLAVSNLGKTFWPAQGITKGELMRYYVWMSRLVLPAVADRPLVMKLHPNGVSGASYYRQRAPADVPPGVRVEKLPIDRVVPSRIIGGSLLTLLYMVQMAVISQDPFFSRVDSLDHADHAVLDLDPMPGVAFQRVLEVARAIEEELEALGVSSVPKTSGASGLHIYIPLRPETTYESARLFCQLMATAVAEKLPKVATVTREVNARGRRVYIDHLQNSRGKTLATAYSARASDFAGVSTPLTWNEVREGVDPRDFTLPSVPARIRSVGDLWAPVRTSKGADLREVVHRARQLV